ncbi:MAG TPA: OadG family protein, partial [Balneolales bacterium]|nr:OadG family protein [Balneolales bacterium]
MLLQFNLNLIKGEDIELMLVGMGVVFSVLTLLYAVFGNLPKILKLKLTKGKRNQAAANETEGHHGKQLTGEINAAISMALYIYLEEQHDEEDLVLTQEKVSRIYSPWSSKIYGVIQFE